MTDIIIIGAGPAGLTAAIYAARAGMSVIVFDRNIYGGQISLTTVVDNYPGLQGIEGVDFANKLYTHATDQGAEVLFEEVTDFQLDGDIKRVTTQQKVYEARAVILANGSSHRRLEVPGEQEFLGRGVSYCATCDAAFFRDKTVAIVGGGDTALNDALFLSNNCKKVYLILRRDVFRAEKVKQEAVRARENVEVLFSTTVKEVKGMEKVDGLLLNTPNGEQMLVVDGVFVAVGQVPETNMYSGFLEMTPDGHARVGEDCATSIPGVYVAGDIRNKPLRQIVTAAADGAVAAVAASEYCNAQADNFACLQSKPKQAEAGPLPSDGLDKLLT